MSSRRVVFRLFVAALALVGSAVVAVPAEAGPAVVHAATPAASDPNKLTAAQALAQAKSSGHAVVATGLTTQSSQITANPDGTLTMTDSATPVRTRQGGAWVSLDPTLVHQADGTYRPNAVANGVTLSGGGTSPLAVLSNGVHQLALTFPMTLPSPSVSGAMATYPNVLPDVDLVVTVDEQGGFADTLVVKTAAAAANPALTTLRIATNSRDLRTSADSTGSISVADPSGRPMYTTPTPMMWDSAAPPATAGPALKTVPKALAQATGGSPVDSATGRPLDSTPVAPGEGAHESQIGVTTDSAAITLTPNQSLLTASSTVFPIYMDPTFNPDGWGPNNSNDWTEVESGVTGYAGWHQNGLEQVGFCGWSGCNGIATTRSYWQWGISSLFNTSVINATAVFNEVYTPACAPAAGTDPIVALEWTNPIGPGTTWNNQPSWSWTQQNNSGMYGHSSACPGQGIGFNVTSQVQQDVNCGCGTITLGLFAQNEGDKYGWKEFSDAAQLTVTYDVTPATPNGQWTSPVTPCTTVSPYPTIGKTDIRLFVNAPYAADGVAKPLAVEFRVTNLGNNATAFDQTIQTTAGSFATLTVSQGTLTTGDYSWSAQSSDGYLPSAWSSPCDIHVDTSQPGPPVIATTDTPAKTVRTADTFTFSPSSGSSTPAAYRYQINSGAPVTVTANGSGVWSGNITPTQIGPNILLVQALSAAGTPGPTAQWQINPAPLPTPDPDGDFSGSGHPDLLVVGGTGGTADGLWLSTGDGTGKLNPPTDIGIRGAGLSTSTGTPQDWHGALVAHGQFTNDSMQDILAVFSDGTPEIYASPGDGSALNPTVGTMTGLKGAYFVDPNNGKLIPANNETITQITAIGSLPDPNNGIAAATNVPFPDLLVVVHDTQAANTSSPYQLWWLQAGVGKGSYTNAQVLDDGHASGIDWSTKTIVGTASEGQPALIVRDNSSGEVDLYPTCGTCTGTNWFANATKTAMVPTGSANANATTATSAPVIGSEDANGDGNPDLWTIGATGAVNYAAGTPSITVGALTSAGTVIPATTSHLVPMGAVNWTPPGGAARSDIYAADSNGNLWDYQRMPSGLLGPPTLAATGHWNNDTVFGVVDFNHDGYPDIILRDNTTCNENVYLGSATGFAATPIQFGSGWCGYTPFGIEDWYGNGHYDVLARQDSDGVLWVYPGDLTSTNSNVNPTQVGGGWTNGAYDPWGIIDFNGDGHPDVITRYEPTDTLMAFVGNGAGGGWPAASGAVIGSGENEYTFFGMIYYNNTTTEPDMILRSDTGPTQGNLVLFKGTGTGGWTDGKVDQTLANGW